MKNLPADKLAKAIRVANAVLKDCEAEGGKDCEGHAIRAGIAAAHNRHNKEGTMGIALAEPTRLSQIVDNFRANVRGVDVAIDQVHDPDRGAAGWIKDLKVDASSSKPDKQALFARVEWTRVGRELVGERIFRYISAEFGIHKDPESGQEYSDVLYAATLTNRPFVKGMQEVSLGEEWIEVLREGDYMHDFYGELSIQADEGVLKRMFSWLRMKFEAEYIGTPTVGTDVPNKEDDMKELIEFLSELGIELDEGADPIAALREYIAALTETEESEEDTEAQVAMAEVEKTNAKLAERVATLEKSLEAEKQKLAEKDKAIYFDELIREGKLRPADRDKFEALYDAAPEKVRELFEDAPRVVDLEEHGTSSDKTADDPRLQKMNELMAEGVPAGDAYIQAYKEDN